MPKTRVVFQETPNPNAGKFTVNRVLREGRQGLTLADPASAGEEAPYAAALLRDPDVVSVFVVDDFVTVTKREAARWKELAPRLAALLREAL
jgi:hypothetical protein